MSNMLFYWRRQIFLETKQSLSLNSKTYLEYTVHHYTVGRHASMCGVRASLCIITVWFACQIANALETTSPVQAVNDRKLFNADEFGMREKYHFSL